MWACPGLALKFQRRLFAMLRILLAGSFVLFSIGAGHANEWSIKEIATLPATIERPAAPDGLPDGEVDQLEFGDIRATWYEQPTTRYAHGILGDSIEAGALVVEAENGELKRFVLPENQVFEDRTPRLVALDGFGKNHVVTLLSEQQNGASIAIFGLVEDELQLIAQTPYVGRANRWRNIAGIADYDGDGNIEIAEVVTPHIGGTLKFWTWQKGALTLTAEDYGFSNHFIGSRAQELSASEDFDGDGVTDLVVPSDNRRTLHVMKFEGPARGKRKLVNFDSITLPARVSQDIQVRWDGEKIILGVGLSDGSALEIVR